MSERSPLVKGGEIGWPFKALLLACALLFGLFDHALHGWGRIAFAAAIAFVAPVIGYRQFWKLGRFWITAVLLLGTQVPLVILAQPYVERLRIVGALTFGGVDCFIVTLAIAWVCSQKE